MMEFMAWLPIIGIFALIGFVQCLRALYAVFKWIRIWIDLKEWPNLEAFRKKYVKPEYQNGFSQADFREFFWSF